MDDELGVRSYHLCGSRRRLHGCEAVPDTDHAAVVLACAGAVGVDARECIALCTRVTQRPGHLSFWMVPLTIARGHWTDASTGDAGEVTVHRRSLGPLPKCGGKDSERADRLTAAPSIVLRCQMYLTLQPDRMHRSCFYSQLISPPDTPGASGDLVHPRCSRHARRWSGG